MVHGLRRADNIADGKSASPSSRDDSSPRRAWIDLIYECTCNWIEGGDTNEDGRSLRIGDKVCQERRSSILWSSIYWRIGRRGRDWGRDLALRLDLLEEQILREVGEVSRVKILERNRCLFARSPRFQILHGSRGKLTFVRRAENDWIVLFNHRCRYDVTY